MKKIYLICLLFLPFMHAIGQDVSTATYLQNKDISSEIPTPTGIAFSSDGTKMFISGNVPSGADIALYELGTAYDVTTAALNASVFLDITDNNYSAVDLTFSNDGTKLLIMTTFFDGFSTFQEEVRLYNLTTGFDLTTASYAASLDVTAEEDFTEGIALNNDGTKLFVIGRTNTSVIEYNMLTAFDLANATPSGNTFDVSGQTTIPESIRFNNDGTQLFVLYSNNMPEELAVYAYNLTTPYAIGTAVYAGTEGSAILDGTQVWAKGMAFTGEDKMYLAGPANASAFIAEYDLEVPAADTTPPTVEISATNDITNSTLETVTFNFTEPVVGFDDTDISITNGGTLSDNFTVVNSSKYTVGINFTNEGTNQVQISEDAFTDEAGNYNDQAFTFDIVYDITNPRGFISILEGQGNFIGTEPIQIGLLVDESITSLELGDLVVENGAVNDLEGPLPPPAGFDETAVLYKMMLTANGAGDVNLNLPAGTVTDLAGNGNDLITADFEYDATPPVVTLDPPAAFVGATPELTGTLDENATVELIINEITYDATVTGLIWKLEESAYANPLSEGVYDVTIKATDLAGNVGTLENPEILNVDITGPDITYNELITNSQSPQLSGTVTDERSGLASLTVTVNGNMYTPEIVNTDWTLNLNDFEEGSYSVVITAADIAGNSATQTFAEGLSVDLTPPTVEIIGFDNEVRSDQHTISFKFSESVTDFEENDINVSNLTIVDFEIVDGENANIIIAATDGLEIGTVIGLSIDANSFSDLAGSPNQEGTSVSDELGIKYSGGSGTEGDPYKIGNEADLRALSASIDDFDKFFIQIADIEMSEVAFIPIGSNNNIGYNEFQGVYDGQEYYIKNLHLSDIDGNLGNFGIGLFGLVRSATLKNIKLVNSKIVVANTPFFGVLVGNIIDTRIEKCSAEGSIEVLIISSFSGYGGGLLGRVLGSVITESFADVDIINVRSDENDNNLSNLRIGGLVGQLAEGGDGLIINDSYSLSNITTNSSGRLTIGGIIGLATDANLSIINSYYAGRIDHLEGQGTVGAIVGESVFKPPYFLSFSNVFWDREIVSVDVAIGSTNGQVTGTATGYSTSEMRNISTFAVWDIESLDPVGDSEPSKTWGYNFYYPYLSWQKKTFKPFVISGKVLDKDGLPYKQKTVTIARGFNSPVKTATDDNGEFSVNTNTKGFHSLWVAGDEQHDMTLYGDTKSIFYSKLIAYDRTVTIRMVPKSQVNNLDGAGRVKGNVVSATGATQMVAGRMLDGDPLAGVQVSLLRVSDNEILITVETDENGVYEITGIPAGEYQLLLNLSGVDVNLEGSTFTMDEAGTPLVISAAVSEEGVVFNIEEEVLGIENEIEVAVYPNPVRDFVNIQIPGKAVARIIDVKGTVLKEESFTDHLKLNISALHSNMYFLEISNSSGRAMRKLIKK